VDGPACEDVDGPACEDVDGPACEDVDGPACEDVDGPACAEVDGPACAEVCGRLTDPVRVVIERTGERGRSTAKSPLSAAVRIGDCGSVSIPCAGLCIDNSLLSGLKIRKHQQSYP
jgi:hypothetical protein